MSNIEKIKQISNFFETRFRDNDIHCEACHTKHTGRNAYSIVIFLYLFEETKEQKYFDLAYAIAKTTMSKLQPDPLHGGAIFMPGNHEGANQSNSVMDAGMCTDMVSVFLLYCQKYNIEIEEKKEWIERLSQHIDEYLADSSLNKTVINQRLWGLTGIISFYKLTKREKDKQHIEEVLEKTFNEQNSDGSFGYTNKKIDSDPQTYFSVYYFSRLIAYICYAVESVNLQEKYEENIIKAFNLVYDCLDFEGKKILDIETKKLFFQASYEVESLSHDIYVSRFVNSYYKYGSNKVLDKIQTTYLKHIDKNGLNCNYEDKPNMLCSFIDNSDFVWYLRSVDFDSDKSLENFEENSRDYDIAGFKVEYEKDKKIITLRNSYYASIGWGRLNGTKIVLGKNSKEVILGKNNYFGLKYMLKRNYGDFKNMWYTSQYNLSYKNSKRKYFIKKLKEFVF
ncbi:hypothetical protein [Aliarcobacter cryaerophilus]|uniref:hypothetical protein n=1 Tax=Aliarcobacter cryaerophilus TaxID=28198 RepID=UPI0021B59DC6|nr:hypothetical protein [Aliarcobacter cryaerophilus]MCT7517019.1 hypothetical protein [Aliarcobacter cryaerophilus]